MIENISDVFNVHPLKAIRAMDSSIDSVIAINELEKNRILDMINLSDRYISIYRKKINSELADYMIDNFSDVKSLLLDDLARVKRHLFILNETKDKIDTHLKGTPRVATINIESTANGCRVQISDLTEPASTITSDEYENEHATYPTLYKLMKEFEKKNSKYYYEFLFKHMIKSSSIWKDELEG